MKTYFARPSDVERRWWVVDVSGKTLGREATRIATLLQGKHKPTYAPHVDVGDFVVVVNAAKVHVTGKKLRQKVYYRHSNYPGGLKAVTLGKMLDKQPTKVIRHAVKGMLSHNPQGRAMLRRLKVYAGASHPHEAQVGAQGRE